MKKINKDNLDQYKKILPKSIKINALHHNRGYYSASFLKKLRELFDRSITSFNEIECKGSASSLRFISDIAKKVTINNSFDTEYDQISKFEDNY